jgi:two-component sensor histidine kinase
MTSYSSEESQALATKLLAIEIIHELLANTTSGHLATALVEQMRELSGARTVIALEHPLVGTSHRILAIEPSRRAAEYSPELLNKYCQNCNDLSKLPDTTLVMPLKAAGELLGALVFIGLPMPDRKGELVRTLQSIIPSVAMALRNAIFQEQLEQKVQERTRDLAHMLEEKEVLLRELYHRTKNTLGVITSLLMLKGAEYADNDGVQKLVRSVEQRIRAIALVHDQLYRSQDLSCVDMGEYLPELLKQLAQTYGQSTDQVNCAVEIGDQYLLFDTVIPFGLIITELISNSCRYARQPLQNLVINLQLQDMGADQLSFIFRDNGPGLSPTELGTPYHIHGKTHGLQVVRALVEHQMGGTMTFGAGPGFELTIYFPLNLYGRRV